MTMALRSVGPVGGFVLGYLCLNSYIDPSLTPTIRRNDPRWLGAWWLGKLRFYRASFWCFYEKYCFT